MADYQTLPEALITAIKNLIAAHAAFAREIEELNALSLSVQTHLDRLVKREGGRTLAQINLADPKPVQLPRAVVPREIKDDPESGAA